MRSALHAYLLDLGHIGYVPAFAIQEWAFKACQARRLPAVVIVQENPAVFTIGRAGSRANLLAGPDALAQQGIEVVEVSRGGDITYHGPGQLIVSPLVFLGDLDLNANQFLHKLEDIIGAILSEYGISTRVDPDYPGVWVGATKIGAVGLAVKSGFTQHGFSINVDLDLAPYQLINPCGVPRMPVTSLAQELGRPVTVNDVKPRLAGAFRQALGIALQPIALDDLKNLVELQSQ